MQSQNKLALHLPQVLLEHLGWAEGMPLICFLLWAIIKGDKNQSTDVTYHFMVLVVRNLKVFYICYVNSFIFIYLSYHTPHIISGLQLHMESTNIINHCSLSANWCVPTTAYKIMKHFTYYWQSIWAVKYGTSQSYSQTPGKVEMNSTGLVKAHVFVTYSVSTQRNFGCIKVKYLWFSA